MNYRAKLASGITLTQFDERVVLFSKATGDSYGLNASASLLLESLLDSDFETTTIKSAAAYHLSSDVIEQDLKELVESLVDLKLVETLPLIH